MMLRRVPIFPANQLKMSEPGNATNWMMSKVSINAEAGSFSSTVP